MTLLLKRTLVGPDSGIVGEVMSLVTEGEGVIDGRGAMVGALGVEKGFVMVGRG